MILLLEPHLCNCSLMYLKKCVFVESSRERFNGQDIILTTEALSLCFPGVSLNDRSPHRSRFIAWFATRCQKFKQPQKNPQALFAAEVLIRTIDAPRILEQIDTDVPDHQPGTVYLSRSIEVTRIKGKIVLNSPCLRIFHFTADLLGFDIAQAVHFI